MAMTDHSNDNIKFNLPGSSESYIKVIGVGGGGSNAVNHMFRKGIKGVDFIVCNTDQQALDLSPVPTKIKLGQALTGGKGAGAKPEIGRDAARENLEDVLNVVGSNTSMVFITAGMGGGTGTGAAPVIAKAIRESGVLTVGIVTIPFLFEGPKRKKQADEGLNELRSVVDTLLVIRNEKIHELYRGLAMSKAFSHADEVLCTAAKGIAEIITQTGIINVDMNDVNTVMRDSGVAIMGSATASGEGRALTAVTQALESPLLNDNDIFGAKNILLNITLGSPEVTMDECMAISEFIQEKAGPEAEVIWGYADDHELGADIAVTVIATGFGSNHVDTGLPVPAPKINTVTLEVPEAREIIQPLDKPVVTAPTVRSEEEPFVINRDEEKVSDSLTGRTVSLFDNEVKPEEVKLTFKDVPSNEKATEVPEPESRLNVFDLETDEPVEFVQAEIKTEEIKFEERIESKEITASEEEVRGPSREMSAAALREREMKIRELTSKIKTASGLAELENQPAFVRNGVKLDDGPSPASEQISSRVTLSEEEDLSGNKTFTFRENPFFTDKPD
jgi:cell division protein FtsZ